MKSVFLVAALICLAAGCVTEKGGTGGRLGVIVSIVPQKEFVEAVGGDRVSVTVMVPPGASPHTYEPTPAQMMAVSDAAMYAKVGSGVEFETVWMEKIAGQNPGMMILDCSTGVELLAGGYEEHDGSDPHIWLAPKNAKIMVGNIYEGLIELDPANQAYYFRNMQEYLKELDALDAELSRAFADMPNRKILVYHSSWAYLASDYGFAQIAIEEGGREPTPAGIIRLVEQAKKEDVKVVFASPQYSSKSAEVIAQEIGGRVVLIDPLAGDYINNLRSVAKALTVDWQYP
ncbi:MAG: zinc ABC transporter substrate-binding protein [Candidatus Altiarchaeota archaeon]|nr:zinc ABC transporter substrate-binding protein [Candidatus Altiarchaeota archaeon]